MGRSKNVFTYNIDILGSCNLRCPSCPVSNMSDVVTPNTVMSLESFEQILAKIKRETPGIPEICIYNWAEPILHPKLPELLRIARTYEIPITVSCNFNLCRNLEEILREEPTRFRVSVSGFFQKTYQRTHQKGNIEDVKANMKLLRQIMDRLGTKTNVEVAYHCYSDNLGDDYAKMKEFCLSLGFRFNPIWAYFMPIEKLLTLFEGGKLTQDDEEVLRLLAISPQQAREISLRNPSRDCVLRSRQTAINSNGSVALCCGVYDRTYTIAPQFTDVSFQELQTAKYKHPLCGPCMDHGIHDLLTHANLDELTRTAESKVGPDAIPPEFRPRRGWRALTQRVRKILGRSRS